MTNIQKNLNSHKSSEIIDNPTLNNGSENINKSIEKSTQNPFEKAGKLTQVELRKQAEKYKRIGTDYYLYTDILTAKKKKVKLLKKWKKTTIKDDHGTKIFDEIEKFIDFVNIPDNTDNYKRNIGDCFNLYEPIPFRPVKGEWIKTEYFLNHIFGEYYDVGIDYLQLMYSKPTQSLPILCLVSKIQNTGKSTFLKWLNIIYGDNAAILGNEDFGSNFNAHWINKLVIGVDESFIEKKVLKEKIKRLATDDSALQENKGVDKIRRDFIGKIILLSNNERNFIQMDQEDNRFFVLKIPKVEKEDPDLETKLEQEIPAFLYFLVNRTLKHKKLSRLWFLPKIYLTDTFCRVVQSTRNIIEKSLIDYLGDLADNIRSIDESKEVDSIDIVPIILAKAIKPSIGNFNALNLKIGDILRDDWNLHPSDKSVRFRYPYFSDQEYGTETGETERIIKHGSHTGTFYKITFSLIDEKRGK